MPLHVEASRNGVFRLKKTKFQESQLCSLLDQQDHTENTKPGRGLQALHCFCYCTHSIRTVDLI